MKLCDNEEIFLREIRIVRHLVFCWLIGIKWIVFQPTKYSPEDPLTIQWEEGIYPSTIDLAYTYIWLTATLPSCWNHRILDQLMCKIAACAVSKRLMNMQHNTRNRNSNRIHQPEAQESKTCPTFPDMWGGHSIPIKHTGLSPQIQYFNIFCVIMEKLAHTSDRRQWAPSHSLALRVTCILKAATQAGWHCLNPANGGTWGPGPGPGQGSSRHLLRLCPLHSPNQTSHLSSQGLFLSRATVNLHISHTKAYRNEGMGYREMPMQVQAVDVKAGGGGAAGPAPSICRRHQKPDNLAGNATCSV